MSIKFSESGRGGLKVKIFTIATALTLSGAAAFAPIAAMADHTTAHTIEQLSAQIAALQAQLLALSGSPAPAPSGTKCTFTRPLTVGSVGDDVKCLQMVLNGSGYTVAASGSGSPGNETTYFGSLTRAAVAKWQAAMGVSPAVGYFGPLSQAKYNTTVVTAPTPTPTPTPTPGPTPVGSGLTVTAPVDQPAAQLVPGSAARVPFVKVILTASPDGDVTVKSLTAERRGPADDVNFDNLLLLDENANQIGNTRTLNSDHKVILSESFVVKAGTSRTVTVAANMVAAGTIQSGQIAKFAVVAVDAGTSKVTSNLPIEGNGMTMNSTLTIGSVTMSIGSLDPGAANTKNVGTKGYYLAGVKAAVGSAEDVVFESIRFNQAGSAATGDLENVMINADGKDYPATVTSDGKYYVANLGTGITITKGNNLEFSIKADLVNGSARTADMDVLRKSDIVVRGKTFGYNIIVSGGSAGAASAGAFSSNSEPFFNAYAATIDKGSLLVSASNAVVSGNIPISVTDTELGSFTFDVKGESMQVSQIVLNFTFTGTGTSSDITGVKLYDSNGGIVAGPKDPASGIVKWTDTWTAPVGANVYKVKGKLDTTFVNNDTVVVSTNPDNMTVKGEVTGLTVTAAPAATLITANTQTVKAAALAFSVSPTPFGQKVVRGGTSKYHFATYIFDATQSGEDARVTSVQLRDTLSATTVGDEVNSCILYDGSTQLNTGSDVVNPSDPTTTNNDITFSLTNNLIIPKGTVKKVDLKCNISSSAAADSTHSWGTNAAAANINSTGSQTSTAITETITTSTGSIMTIKSAGSFTVDADSSQPVAGLVLSGKTNVPMQVLRYHAVDEAINIKELTLTFSSSTASTSDFLKATVWDGATLIGTAQWAGSATNATTTFSAPFVVPKDGDRLLTIKADVASISVSASTTAGRLLQIGYNGISSSTGVGESSGAKLGSGTAVDKLGNAQQIMKSMPTVTKIAVPSTSLPQTNAILYRFSVYADPAGPIALYKVAFTVSSSTVSATTSNFNLYGYSNSTFSASAYAINPLHSGNVDCVQQSNLDTNTACKTPTADVGQTSTASSTGSKVSEVVFFFDPVANTASSTEAIIVPAGETRYFEMRGDITNPGSGTGNSVAIDMLGDTARPVRNGGVVLGANAGYLSANQNFGDSSRSFLATANEVAAQSASNNFVWSPLSTSSVLSNATNTTDWTNGFKVPGLPENGLSANTFSN